MVLCLDPSSTCIGWATFPEPTPSNADPKPERFGKIASNKPRAWDRMILQTRQVFDLIETDCRVVVIEIPDGKVHGRMKSRSGGAGLSVYGMAVGYLIGKLTADPFVELHPITQTQWTNRPGVRVVQSKEQRQAWVALRHKNYNPAKDDGGDVADAISLGEWWFTERNIAARAAGVTTAHMARTALRRRGTPRRCRGL